MVRQPATTPPGPEQIEAWVEEVKSFDTADVYDLNPRASSWTEHTNCVPGETGIFRSGDPEDILTAKEMCAECIVCKPCLEYALRFDTRHPVGSVILGGKTLQERREMLGLDVETDEPIQLPDPQDRIQDDR